MTKNMTRKGLALGSTLALVASAVVGFAAPAQASTLVVIPSSGTSTTTISGEAFSVKVLGQFAGTDDLAWEIAGIDTANETVAAVSSGGGSATGTTTKTLNVTAPTTASGSNALTVAIGAAETGSVTVRAYIESGDAVGFNATFDTSYSAPLTLNYIQADDVTAVTTITSPLEGDTSVEASMYFVGINNEQLAVGDVGVYLTDGTGTKLTSTVTVTSAVISGTGTVITFGVASHNFVSTDSITVSGVGTGYDGTYTLNGSTTSTALVATITGGADGTAATPAADWLAVGTVSAAKSTLSGVAWSTTKSAFVYSLSLLTPLADATGIKAQPVYNAGGSVASTDTIATAAVATVAELTAATVTGASVVSTTANVGNESLLNSSWSVKATVEDDSTVPVAVAGAAVTAVVTSSRSLSATVGSVISLAVAGTTYTADAALPGTGSVARLALTTDANGEVVVPLSTVGFTAADTVTVTFYTENISDAVTSTQRAATYTVNHAAFVTTTDGASVSVPVSVYDQFGGRPANDSDVRAVFATGNGNYSAQATTASTTATSTSVALVSGNATLVITDNGTGLGVNSYDVTVEKRAAGGGYSGAITGSSAIDLDVHIKTAASLVAATVTSNGTQNATTKVYAIAGPVALSLVGTAAYDSTTVLGTAPSTFTAALTAQNITGTVSTVASATQLATVVPGASVTISGAGLQFGIGGKYSVGSITVVANTSGVYSANVYSNMAGKQTLTISSGSASATTTVVFAQAKDDTGTSIVVTAPDYVMPGSTLKISSVLSDKYGNTVTLTGTEFNNGTDAPTFSLTSDSPGLQIGDDPTTTANGGKADLAYFLGQNEAGTITVTATYDADGTGTAFDTITVTKTVIIGVAPVVSDTKVNVGSFKGFVALYAKGHKGSKMSAIVAGKWIVVASLATDFERVVRYTGAGYDIVTTIYIDGVKVQTFNVTTK